MRLSPLTKDDIWVVEQRLKGRTLEDIGNERGCSKERARQILSRAFRTLIRANYRWEAGQRRCAAMARRVCMLEASLNVPPGGAPPSLESPIEELELPLSAYLALKAHDIHHIGDVAEMSEADLRTSGMNMRHVMYIRFRLLRYGIVLSVGKAAPDAEPISTEQFATAPKLNTPSYSS